MLPGFSKQTGVAGGQQTTFTHCKQGRTIGYYIYPKECKTFYVVKRTSLLCPGPNVIKLFTAVIYCHSMVIPSFSVINQNYLGNYCGMAVNYHGICVTNVIKQNLTKNGSNILRPLNPRKSRVKITVVIYRCNLLQYFYNIRSRRDLRFKKFYNIGSRKPARLFLFRWPSFAVSSTLFQVLKGPVS